MKRKLLLLLLAACLCLTPASALAAGAASSAENELPFTDVSAAVWYYGAVQYATDNNLMRGYTATAFGPDRQITAGQYLTVLYRMGLGLGVPYPDLDTSGPNWLAAARYLDGGERTDEQLNQPITREEMAHYGAGFLRTVCGALNTDAVVGRQAAFTDADTVNPLYTEEVNWFCGIGAISGYTDGTYRPTNEVKRCEAARVFYNLLNAVTLQPAVADTPATAETPAADTPAMPDMSAS